MIWIALSRKGNPGVGHSAAKVSRFGTAAGHRRGTIGIVEDKGKLSAVEGARASVQHGGLPGKPEHVYRRAAESSLALRLSDAILPAFRRERDRENVKRFRFRVNLLVGSDDVFRAILKTLAGAAHNLIHGHFFIFWVIDPVRHLV